MQVNMQAIIYKAMTAQIRNKIVKLIKSGITDETLLFNETMKNAKDNEQFKNLMTQSGIDMDIVEETVKEQIKEVLSKPEKKGLLSKIFSR